MTERGTGTLRSSYDFGMNIRSAFGVTETVPSLKLISDQVSVLISMALNSVNKNNWKSSRSPSLQAAQNLLSCSGWQISIFFSTVFGQSPLRISGWD